MSDQFINIRELVPERLRDEPLLKEVIESLEFIYYQREDNVSEQLEAIRDKYVTYLVLAREPAKDIFQMKAVPDATEITPTVYMDVPLIKRERVSHNFGVGTFRFITTALSLESISEIIKDLPVTELKQISDVQLHMQEGYFEENCLYEITTAMPVAIEYTGLAHGHQVPLERIEDPTLGHVFDSKNLRGSDLYAMEPGFPYLAYSDADEFEWVLEGKRHRVEDLDLSRSRNEQVISEFGYQYLLDALGMTPMDVALIRSFITTIHWLKGSRKGVNLMLDLLELNDYVQIVEWWEDDPTGETVEPMSYRIEVDLRDNKRFRSDTLQALRLFMRQYVYPLLRDFALVVNFVDERLKTAVNALTFQTLNGTINSPVVIAPKMRVFQNVVGGFASPLILGVNGLLDREYNVTMEDVRSEYDFQMANEELRTGFNILPRMEVTGQTSTQVLFGMAGVGHTRHHGTVTSPIVVTANGVIDRELSVSFEQQSTEQLVNFELSVANGTQGFIKQYLSAEMVSPMLLLVGGSHDQEYTGTIQGDLNDAP